MKSLVVVLGASGFLGTAVSRYFRGLSNGGRVLTLDLAGAEHEVDLADGLSLGPLLEKYFEEEVYGELVIINCAGSTVFTDTLDRSPSEIAGVAMSQLGISIFAMNALAEVCAQRRIRGVGVLISSLFAAHAPRFEIYENLERRSSEIYGATKAGIEQLTRYYAKLLGPEGVRVNCVSPGGILDETVHTREFQRKYSSATALGRMVSVEEVVAAISFLVSEQSSGITGAVIPVDCGYGLS